MGLEGFLRTQTLTLETVVETLFHNFSKLKIVNFSKLADSEMFKKHTLGNFNQI